MKRFLLRAHKAEDNLTSQYYDGKYTAIKYYPKSNFKWSFLLNTYSRSVTDNNFGFFDIYERIEL